MSSSITDTDRTNGETAGIDAVSEIDEEPIAEIIPELGIPHDQLFKETLREFLQDFLEMMLPDIASKLDFSRVEFLDKEVFTDFPKGLIREADILLEIYTKQGEPEIVIIHVEVERWRRANLGARMHEYYMAFRLRKRHKVIPIVVYLSPSLSRLRETGGITMETYEEAVFDTRYVTFSYHAIGLPDLRADDYRNRETPLGGALAALMRTSDFGRIVQKFDALRQIVSSGVNDARKYLLANMVEFYLKLDAHEARVLRERLMEEQEGQTMDAQEAARIMRTVSIMNVRLENQGREQGVQEAEQETLLRFLMKRFGQLPEHTVVQVKALDTEGRRRLEDAFFSAQTLEEVMQSAMPPANAPSNSPSSGAVPAA